MRKSALPALAISLLVTQGASGTGPALTPGSCPGPATEAVQVRAGQAPVAVPDGADPAPPKARPSSSKGWLESAKGTAIRSIPAGVRVIEPYGERLFVEMPESARASLAKRGLLFHEIEDADLLSVGDERFDPAAGEPSFSSEWQAGTPGTDRRPYIVKFDAPIKPEWLAEMESAGARIVQYQANFGYLLLVPPGADLKIKMMDHVGFGGEYHAAYKATPALRARAAGDDTLILVVSYFDVPGWEQRVDEVTMRHGARLSNIVDARSTSQWAMLHEITYENVRTRDLPEILGDPAVYRADEWHPLQLDGERAAQITAGNISGGQPTSNYYSWLTSVGADGTGVTVAVADTGVDTGNAATIHGDFKNRTAFATSICANSRDQDGHGTNTASIAVGDPRLPLGTGLTDPGGFFWGSGSAPKANLWVQKALNDGDCATSFAGNPTGLAADAVHNGLAQIGSHSFTDGLTPGSSYTSTCATWDARVRDADPNVAGNQPYMVVFSAGNSGPSASSLSSPHAAKNILSVAASENFRPTQCPGVAGCGGPADDIDTLVDFSSRGPTTDGRIKPDITTPGHVIVGAKSSVATYDCFCDGGGGAGCCASTSVDGSNKYSVYSGTSQAAPRAAGAAAVVFDWFKDRFGVFPSPAMAKAILISGATDMKTLDVPNNNEGWGRVSLKTSFDAGSTTGFTDQTTVIGTTGDAGAFTTNYFVQDTSKPVKADLVWTDPAGAAGCNPCLVNDLDLLMTQGATTWRGNNFTAGFTNTGAVADNRNNVEGINLAAGNLTCASFQMKVRATTLNGDGVPGNADATDQDFALVVGNAGTSAGPAKITSASSAIGGGCDGDVFLDRRETATLTIQIKNVGCTNGSGVTAAVSVDTQPAGANITVSPAGPQAIGSINAGATTPHGWSVSLADNASAFCGQKARLRVDYADGLANTWTDFVEVTLDADSFTTVTNTNPATDPNLFFSKDATEWNLASCRFSSSPTSWHMGQTDCSGIVRDASTRDLVFAYNIPTGAIIKELSFQHAFNGYFNANFSDSVHVQIDPENDGTFVTLQSWFSGINAPTTFPTLGGPYDLTAYNATRAPTVKVRFRFVGGANWVGGANTAAGWDLDDIVFKYDAIVCDGGSCPVCGAPSGLTNNTAVDASSCLTSGIAVTWPQDPGAWNDLGGTRTYTVLRDNVPVASGPCGGSIAYGTTSCTDTTVAPGTSATYKVRYNNGCSQNAATAGASASDVNCAPPPVNDGRLSGLPVQITRTGTTLNMTWDATPGATRYNIYMGTIGSTNSHAIFSAVGLNGADSCFEPTNAAAIEMPAGSVYFLVAADNGTVESVLGDSLPTARPYASPACAPH